MMGGCSVTAKIAPVNAAAGAADVTKRAVTVPPAALPTALSGKVGAPNTAPLPASEGVNNPPPVAA